KVTPRATYYVYDNEDIIMEYQLRTPNSKLKTIRYIHGPGIDEPLVIEQKGKVYYYHADGLGSITALTDGKGKVVQRYDYDSFGKLKRYGNKVKNSYTYTCREYDRETELYYYRARYYDAKVGRFINRDPIGFEGGINLYVYVGNNPVSYIDPLGLLRFKSGVKLSNQGLLLKLILLESKLPKECEIMVTEGDRTFQEYTQLYPHKTMEDFKANTHSQGIAADVNVVTRNGEGCKCEVSIQELANKSSGLGFTGIGIYDRHLHIDERNVPYEWTGTSK
ncbi:MAG: RHS repeat-associated core domain-containing protein, partial [Nitrospinota bacterium]